MAQTVSIIVSPEEQVRLAEVIGDRNTPQKQYSPGDGRFFRLTVL
ncbi:hypothetical protein [Paramagnetospirillum magneticum]|nr:hypothetical protein [Paramagnetospirillum magneticum]